MEVDSRPPWERLAQTSSKKSFNPLKFLLSPVAYLFKKQLFAVIFVLIIAGVLTGAYFYLNITSAGSPAMTVPQVSKNTDPRNVAEVKKIIEDVGKLTILPNETPAVATVADVKSLQMQPFFEKAKNGDKVLIFEKAKRAILYRPSTNKIIEIGPVDIPSPTTVISGTPSPSPSATVSPTSRRIVSPTPLSSPTP